MSPRRQHFLSGLGLILLASLVLGHVCGNDFINMDDPHYVTANDQVNGGLTESSLRWAWTTFHAGYWMPLTWLSLQLDASLYWPRYPVAGTSSASAAAWGFHLTNLLLHLANTLLVYWLLLRLTRLGGWAVLIAALFAVHPLHVESVAWITERKDVLSTFFGLLALLAYLRFQEKPGWVRYLVCTLALALSLMAKPMLVTLPAIMLLLDYWPLGRLGKVSWTRLVLEKGPFFGLSLLITAITIFAQQQAGAVSALDKLPLNLRLANAVVSYEGYLVKTFWPQDLTCFYPHPGATLTFFQVLRAGLVMVGITALVVAARRKLPAMLVGWLWFVGTLAPVIGLIQAGEQGMADRFTYVPLIGLFLALVAGGDYLAGLWDISLLMKMFIRFIMPFFPNIYRKIKQ